MITFQAQGCGEVGSGFFFTPIRELARLVLRVPVPFGSPRQKRAFGEPGLSLGKNWGLLGKLEPEYPAEKEVVAIWGRQSSSKGRRVWPPDPLPLGRGQGLVTQVRSEPPRHSADDHGGPLKRLVGGGAQRRPGHGPCPVETTDWKERKPSIAAAQES